VPLEAVIGARLARYGRAITRRAPVASPRRASIIPGVVAEAESTRASPDGIGEDGFWGG
jgi:hypothetical protein